MPITHSAHKQALLDLHNYMENETDLPEASPTEIERAKAEVAKDMGWQEHPAARSSGAGTIRPPPVS